MHRKPMQFSAAEYGAGALTFTPVCSRHLECASFEPCGTLLLWGQEGQLIEVSAVDVSKLSALMNAGPPPRESLVFTPKSEGVNHLLMLLQPY
jgi:hypothetical protein